MVRRGRESFKRIIKTIIEQVSAYIGQYPPHDQLLLTEFFSILQYYEEADYQRRRLSHRLEEYNKRIEGTDKYLQTAFLWFVYTYFSNANLLLNISKFHAILFYEYLAKHLRGSNGTLGVYRLIREKTPLESLAWEQLQYESNKLLIPLTEDELQILNTVYSLIAETGVYILDPHKLRAAIVKRVSFPKKLKPTTELNRLFTRMDGRWYIRFVSPAFGLTRVFFQMELNESITLEDIIDFQNPDNMVLCVSDVYRARDAPNTYIGLLLAPTNNINSLENYFKNCEHQRDLTLKEFNKITVRSIHFSLTQYQANVGWIEPNSTEMGRVTQFLTREDFANFISPKLSHWDFLQHPLPTKIIEFYCDISPQNYIYSTLPLTNQAPSSLTRDEIGLLKQICYNQAAEIAFIPWRLVYDFSLDLYCIVISKIAHPQLDRFQNLFPFSEIYFGENSIYFLTRMPRNLVNWIENELNWPVVPIIRKYTPSNLEFNWFDSNKLRWKTPSILGGQK